MVLAFTGQPEQLESRRLLSASTGAEAHDTGPAEGLTSNGILTILGTDGNDVTSRTVTRTRDPGERPTVQRTRSSYTLPQ